MHITGIDSPQIAAGCCRGYSISPIVYRTEFDASGGHYAIYWGGEDIMGVWKIFGDHALQTLGKHGQRPLDF